MNNKSIIISRLKLNSFFRDVKFSNKYENIYEGNGGFSIESNEIFFTLPGKCRIYLDQKNTKKHEEVEITLRSLNCKNENLTNIENWIFDKLTSI